MKKFVIVSMIILSALSLFGQKHDKIYFSGSVKGFVNTPCVVCDFSMEGVEPDTLKVAANGTFSKEYMLSRAKEVFLKIGEGKQTKFYVAYFVPGKSLHVDFVAEGESVIPHYSGDTGKETAYLNLHRELITLSPMFSAQAWQAVPDFKACVRYVDEKLVPIKEALDKVDDKVFVEKEKKGLKNELASHYFSYADAKQKTGVDMEKDVDFMKYVKGIDFNDTLQERALMYYLNWYVGAHPNLYPKGMPVNAVKLLCLKTIVSNQDLRNKVARTLLTAHLFMQMLGANISETLPCVYREYLDVSTDAQTCEYARAQLKIIDNTAVGTDAADLKMVDINGKSFSLKDVVGKGKYTYIDFWATWCGPCCKEIPFIEKLVAKYKDHSVIRFVSISIDTDIAAWKKKLITDKPTWEQYLIPEANQKTCAEIYGITNIPRFMIFDKEGKMMDASAPRPSETKTDELLNGLK